MQAEMGNGGWLESPLIVLFACRQNAGRSQMAAAWFNALADPRRARAVSAGTQPASQVHPPVVATMREVGLDLSGAVPQPLTPDLAAGARWLITMGCGEACPVIPGARVEDWPVADPADQPADQVRAIRQAIAARVEALLDRERWR
jgi:arsenate reductase